MGSQLEEWYENAYTNDESFQNIYLKERIGHYQKVMKIIKKLGCLSILDIGCSYGLLVDLCNQAGLDSYGLDLPIKKLIEHHNKLEYWAMHFTLVHTICCIALRQ